MVGNVQLGAHQRAGLPNSRRPRLWSRPSLRLWRLVPWWFAAALPLHRAGRRPGQSRKCMSWLRARQRFGGHADQQSACAHRCYAAVWWHGSSHGTLFPDSSGRRARPAALTPAPHTLAMTNATRLATVASMVAFRRAASADAMPSSAASILSANFPSSTARALCAKAMANRKHTMSLCLVFPLASDVEAPALAAAPGVQAGAEQTATCNP